MNKDTINTKSPQRICCKATQSKSNRIRNRYEEVERTELSHIASKLNQIRKVSADLCHSIH